MPGRRGTLGPALSQAATAPRVTFDRIQHRSVNAASCANTAFPVSSCGAASPAQVEIDQDDRPPPVSVTPSPPVFWPNARLANARIAGRSKTRR